MIQESLLAFKKIYSRITKELNTPEERNFKVFPDRRNSRRLLSRGKLATVKFIVQCSFFAGIVVFCMCQLFLNASNETFYISLLNRGCCFLVQAMLPEGFPFHQFIIKHHSWKYNSNTRSQEKGHMRNVVVLGREVF